MALHIEASNDFGQAARPITRALRLHVLLEIALQYADRSVHDPQVLSPLLEAVCNAVLGEVAREPQDVEFRVRVEFPRLF
eukprot:13290793-Alexandrium_andersonii.AAC.2